MYLNAPHPAYPELQEFPFSLPPYLQDDPLSPPPLPRSISRFRKHKMHTSHPPQASSMVHTPCTPTITHLLIYQAHPLPLQQKRLHLRRTLPHAPSPQPSPRPPRHNLPLRRPPSRAPTTILPRPQRRRLPTLPSRLTLRSRNRPPQRVRIQRRPTLLGRRTRRRRFSGLHDVSGFRR